MPNPAKRTVYLGFRKTIVMVFRELVIKLVPDPAKRDILDPCYRRRVPYGGIMNVCLASQVTYGSLVPVEVMMQRRCHTSVRQGSR